MGQLMIRSTPTTRKSYGGGGQKVYAGRGWSSAVGQRWLARGGAPGMERYRPPPQIPPTDFTQLRKQIERSQVARQQALILWRQQSPYWQDVKRDLTRRIGQAKSSKMQSYAWGNLQKLARLKLVTEAEYRQTLNRLLGGR